jgi:hypothetical protein
MANRDSSTEKAVENTVSRSEEEAPVKEPRKMVPNQVDVGMGKRTQITKSARRFERYGHVKDGQDLVRLVADIAGAVEGKDAEVVATRYKKD